MVVSFPLIFFFIGNVLSKFIILVLLNWHEPLEIIREIFPNWKPVFYMRNSGKLKSKFILIMLLKHSRRMQENKLFGYIIFIARRRSVTPKLRNCRIFRFQSVITIFLGQVHTSFIIFGHFYERTVKDHVVGIFSDALSYTFNVK